MGNTCGVTLRSSYFVSFRGSASRRRDTPGYAPAAATAASNEPASQRRDTAGYTPAAATTAAHELAPHCDTAGYAPAAATAASNEPASQRRDTAGYTPAAATTAAHELARHCDTAGYAPAAATAAADEPASRRRDTAGYARAAATAVADEPAPHHDTAGYAPTAATAAANGPASQRRDTAGYAPAAATAAANGPASQRRDTAGYAPAAATAAANEPASQRRDMAGYAPAAATAAANEPALQRRDTAGYAPAAATAAADEPAPNGKRATRPAAQAGAAAVDGSATHPAPGMRRGVPAPAELRANVLGHPTPNLRDHYALGRKLGQGEFGTTYLCTDLATGVDYACKSIAKRKLITREDVENVRREIKIMHHLAGHRNVVAIKGAFEDKLFVHIVMELCVGGDMSDRIIQRGHYSELKAAELMRIIVGVVEACHSLGVMHRDLKPENFLLVNKDDDMSLKAIDFGLSVFFKPGQIFTDVVGSRYYVAPEVLRKRYGPEADVWSAGVILYILLSGVPPFWADTEQGIFDAILKGVIDFDSDPWSVISESAKDLIRRMLNPVPSERLTAHEVLCHRWICDHGVAPDRSLDPAVLSRIKQFSAMNN